MVSFIYLSYMLLTPTMGVMVGAGGNKNIHQSLMQYILIICNYLQ